MSKIKIPLRKPDIIDTLTASLSDAEATMNALSSPHSNNFTKHGGLAFLDMR